MTIIGRAFGRERERRFYAPSSAGDPWVIPSNGSLAAYTSSGVPVTEETAMSLLVVAACVRILSTNVAGLPLDSVVMDRAYRRTLEPPPLIVSDPFGGANNLRLPSRRAGLIQMMISLLLRGNAFALVLSRNQYGYPSRLMVLHPDMVTVDRDPDGQKTYLVRRVPVPPEDMVHLVGMSMPGSAVGLSVLSYARTAIGLGLAAEEFGSRFFGSGAHLSGVIEVPGDLDRERARNLKENFESKHAGLRNAHQVGVLTGGAQWKPISVTPEDAQFLGTRAAQNLDLAMLFGIPPHMLGQVDRTTSWGTGIEQQTLGYLQHTLSFWIGVFEDAWSAMLPKPQVARFNVNAFLRTDTAGRYAAYMQARTGGWMTKDEIRANEDMPPLPDGKGTDPDAPLNSATSGAVDDSGEDNGADETPTQEDPGAKKSPSGG